MKARALFFSVVSILFASMSGAQTVTTNPSPPRVGEPFDLIVSGIWRDSCVPANPRLLIANYTLHVTYTLAGGVCLSAVTPYSTTLSVPPLDAGTYEVRARLFDSGPVPFFTRSIEVAGTPLGITSIEPYFDTSAGNRVVVIRGGFPCQTLGCPPPKVFFGSKEAEAVERISDFEMHAVVPAQTGVRVVNVAVRGATYERRRPSGFTYVNLLEYERVLVPAFTRDIIPGAFGSRWQTEFTMLNRSSIELEPDVDLFHLEPRCVPSCKVPVPSRRLVTPIFAMPLRDVASPPTLQFYVRTELMPFVSFALRARDLSRQAESWGTEIPVVREKDLASRVTLIDIPMQPRFRQMLRIYMTDYVGCCGARVTFFSPEGTELHRRELSLTRPNGTIGGLVPPPYLREGSREFALQPAYLEVALGTIPELAGQERIWLTVEAASPPSRLWAFVSVTNDETQQVTTVTPR